MLHNLPKIFDSQMAKLRCKTKSNCFQSLCFYPLGDTASPVLTKDRNDPTGPRSGFWLSHPHPQSMICKSRHLRTMGKANGIATKLLQKKHTFMPNSGRLKLEDTFKFLYAEQLQIHHQKNGYKWYIHLIGHYIEQTTATDIKMD